jgi:hypothetical protein
LRPGLDLRRVAGVVLEAVSFNVFATTISGLAPRDGDDPEALWNLLFGGFGKP